MSNNLSVGIGREIITPEIGGQLFGYRPDIYSESVNDDLTVTAFYFEKGDKKAFMITATVCLIDTKIYDELSDELSKKYGVDKNDIIISATHTHSGPSLLDSKGWGDIDYEYYNSIFRPNLLKATETAFNSAEAVTVGIGSGMSKVGINRRELRLDNVIYLGQNPWGPYNPEMTVISFKNSENKVIGNIIHYGCHGTVAGANVEISRDWSGIMTDALEELSGGITAFFNGPEGDVGPRISNGCTTADISYVPEVGEMGAKDACEIFRNINKYEEVDISTASGILQVPVMPRLTEEYADRKMNECDPDAVNIEKQTYEYYKSVKDSYKNGYEEKEFREIPQTVIGIGKTAFVSFPYELFSEIGMRIDTECKDMKILSLSNTNGSMGYFSTQDQICRGGYEIDCFKYNEVQEYVDDADHYLILETLKTIERLEK